MKKLSQHIIQSAISRDKQAEKELFMITAPRMFSLCRRYANDDHEAQDYLQEIYIKMFDKLHLFDINKASFFTWFHTIASNRIIELVRKKKTFCELPSIEQVEQLDDGNDYLDSISEQQLQSAIAQLPEGYRNVINLVVFEKCSHKEIAQKLNIAESTSRSQFARSKKLLKKILKESISNSYERKLA